MMMRGRVGALALLLLTVPFPASAASPRCAPMPPGLVIGYTGSASGYAIERNRRPISLYLYSELQGGDQVRVLRPDGQLLVAATDTSVVKLTYASPLNCVTASREASMATNFMRELGKLFERRREGVGGDLVARGDDDPLTFVPSDLASGTASVAAGTRRIVLAWTGGQAPFHATIAHDTIPIVDAGDLQSRLLRTIVPRDLLPGDYVVSLSDKNGRTVISKFHVFGSKSGDAQATSNETAVAHAATLLALGKDRQFEALIELGPYLETDDTAKTLIDVLRSDAP